MARTGEAPTPPRPAPARGDKSSDARRRGAQVSVVVGTVLLGGKYLAYQVTGSTAILSDALESMVNVIAALFALGGLVVAGWPAGRRHPHADGKIEFFGAAFEGGLITLAAALIIKEAGEAFMRVHQVREIQFGLLITIGAGLVNAALGWFLVRSGRRHASFALVAHGTHVLADVWTGVATAIALALVQFTRQEWVDPTIAAMIGINLLWAGLRRVRHAAGGLLDEEDSALLERVVVAINGNLVPGVIRVHGLRAIRSGHFTHVDAQLVVPEFWTVEEADTFCNAFERRTMRGLDVDGEIAFRVEPCHRQFCASCEVEPCPIRVQPFVSRSWVTLDDAMRSGPAGQ